MLLRATLRFAGALGFGCNVVDYAHPTEVCGDAQYTPPTERSVVNNDNWKRWLITRFEHFGCAVMPPRAPNIEDFE